VLLEPRGLGIFVRIASEILCCLLLLPREHGKRLSERSAAEKWEGVEESGRKIWAEGRTGHSEHRARRTGHAAIESC